MKKIPGNLLKNLEKSWKYHGILSVRKSGNPGLCYVVYARNLEGNSQHAHGEGCAATDIPSPHLLPHGSKGGLILLFYVHQGVCREFWSLSND